MKKALFKDRLDAGRYLARELTHCAYQPDIVVLALPRGGVPVAFEIAEALELPLDVFVVRKLGVPGYEELALGALASGGVCVLNSEVIQHLGISRHAIEAVAADENEQLRRLESIYRGDRDPLDIQGIHVILVDDGLATGATMRAAVQALRRRRPRAITVAVPVSSRDTCNQFRSEVDEIICGKIPAPFMSVGQWYQDFTQTSDEQVSGMLNHAAHLRRAQRVLADKSDMQSEPRIEAARI